MSNRKVGPFPGLSDVGPLLSGSSAKDRRDLVSRVRGVLQDGGCRPTGTAREKVRDEGWEADLAQFVLRSVPHTITPEGGTAHQVSLKLSSLLAIIDDDGEVMAWRYIED